MKTKIIGAILAFFLLTVTAQSQSCHKVKNFQGNKRERIKQGWKSGELTPGEMKQFRMEQKKFYLTKKRMQRDGKLDPREKHKLRKMKKHANRQLWIEKHDHQKRKFR